VDGLWATKSECVGLIVRAINLEDYVLAYVITIHQRYRQTDRQTTCNLKTALYTIVHRAVMKWWWLWWEMQLSPWLRGYCV